jgi:aminoglycoside phosphotransferase (APT) family kinase protein
MAYQQETIVDTGELPGLSPAAVERWLLAHARDLEPPLEFGLVAAGGSNLTYRVLDGNGRRFILRRPPVGPLLPSAHNVAREYRIMAALRGSDVPVPRTVVLCDDASVCGAPFYLMAYVEGRILRDTAAGAALGLDAARRASGAFVDALAAIHAVDPAAVGLDGLSRPTGYVERQLRRWYEQYRHTAGGAADPLVGELHRRLAAHVPPEDPRLTGRLTHGDFHIDNAVFDGDLRVRAVLDWELSALGAPLADLAWALMFWVVSPADIRVAPDPATAAPGFFTRDEVVARYAATAGADLGRLDYYLAFAHWKLACLLQAALYRARAGQVGGGRAAGRGGDAHADGTGAGTEHAGTDDAGGGTDGAAADGAGGGAEEARMADRIRALLATAASYAAAARI